jgi:hypothetical protein
MVSKDRIVPSVENFSGQLTTEDFVLIMRTTASLAIHLLQRGWILLLLGMKSKSTLVTTITQ